MRLRVQPGLVGESVMSTANGNNAGIMQLAPIERLGQPVDIANVVAFLAGPDGAWVNAQILRVNGGIV
jgi:3-oxoacyl-[acyl-carrier protein] reductase